MSENDNNIGLIATKMVRVYRLNVFIVVGGGVGGGGVGGGVCV